MITYQEENYEDVWKDVIPILDEHGKEIEVFSKDHRKINPNWAWYKILSDGGFLHVTTARKDTELVGYCVFIISQFMHCTSIMIAENDTIFLKKEYRKGITGYKLLKHAVDSVKQKAQLITVGTKVRHNFGSLLSKLGFKLTEYRYTMEI